MGGYTRVQRLAAEFLGSSLLLTTVIGSGIMGERLSGGNVAIALLANTLATGATLVTLIFTFGAVSGAHFNPVVSLAVAANGRLRWGEVPGYIAAQLVGAFGGVAVAHAMFGLPAWTASSHVRQGLSLVASEAVASFGLLAVILGLSRSRPTATAYAVGAYILAAYWFTASTSFANPAVTIARALTDTFTGIRPADVPGFVVGQVLGAGAAVALFGWFEGAKK